MSESVRGIPESLARLMASLSSLPGIGPRSAERIAFHLLRAPRDEALALADAIRSIKESLRHCSQCFNLTEEDLCPICRDPRRDRSFVVVVEQPKDVMLLEQTGLIQGVYHVLMGHIAPLENVGPADLTIGALVERVKQGAIREVLVATNPTMEGDGTALYIQSVLEPLGVKLSRLARGLAVGSQVEYASRAMLEAAIKGRTSIS
ncbi:MAG TPA: recombination mediator RecR [Phycisphaerae bacterium]|nr:recombination mediator RecR [Phycisphaerae bacterium]HOJ72498.1 recombination mediator RecR [Phycisphaerae bacterium]HOM49840.1 recombination mediator RecR [Phycisphaerae bacterium]HON65600.1 recombination mediator RecR [Phycisphaerae bacterium]HOQ84288.1 recombination mediator RecR [Phycisphaerae bacterium]